MADDHWYPFSDKSEDEDTLLDRAYDRWEQMGGAAAARGPLFQFTMQPIGRRRRWCEVVERAQFNAQLRQLRDPVPGDNIGMALTEALRQAIETELDREQRPAHHFVNSAIMAHGFTHAYQIANFTVGEFLQRTARLDEMLATLASKLNSNKAFNPDRGFQVDVVFISMPGPGSGRHKKKLNPGRLCLDRDNKKKNVSSPFETDVVSQQCQSIKTCLECQAQYTVVPDRRHKCGHAKFPVCQEWVSIQDHKCYIQPVVEEDEASEPTEEGGGSMVAPPPPLFVYADFEAMQDAEGVFVANLLCYSSSEETTIHVLDGEDCALQFLHDLDDLTDVPNSKSQREILVVFHNLKGFDGMFILH